jgi:hypothetical protein
LGCGDESAGSRVFFNDSRTLIRDPSVFGKFVFFFRDMSRWDTYQPFDPVPPTGDTIMEESWLLCLDEFMVRKKTSTLSGSARIRIHFGRLDPDPDPHWEYGPGSGSRRAKMNHKSEENSSFEVPDVLF